MHGSPSNQKQGLKRKQLAMQVSACLSLKRTFPGKEAAPGWRLSQLLSEVVRSQVMTWPLRTCVLSALTPKNVATCPTVSTSVSMRKLQEQPLI